MNMRNRRQQGFTLIELVMVIVILGILAAFALPRFADLTGDARQASLQGLAGALKSASAIARSAQLAGGGTLGASVTLEGSTVTMVNGYPTANSAGIVAAAGINTADYTVTGGGTGGNTTLTFQIAGYTGVATCQVTYTSANAATANTAPITAAASVAVTTTGC